MRDVYHESRLLKDKVSGYGIHSGRDRVLYLQIIEYIGDRQVGDIVTDSRGYLYTADTLDIHEDQDLFVSEHGVSAGKTGTGNRQRQQHACHHLHKTAKPRGLAGF